MTSIKGRPRVFSSPADLFALVPALCLFLAFGALTAAAQTASLEVNVEGESAQFVARGQLSEVSVEVYAPSGELVFQSSAVSAGQAVTWDMTDEAGAPVADGVYTATVSMRADSGKLRKRIEQIIVNRESLQSASGKSEAEVQPLSPLGPTPQAVGAISGQGTIGKVAKFTGANAVGDSVITESAGRVGVNIAPTSVLQVNGAQPPPLAANGTAATTLLQTSGGKGGNTTGSTGQIGGTGASISLAAGNGGDAPNAGGKRGKGGSITLQPGGTGGGAGTGGANGNVLLAPTGVGNVGIGTNVPVQKLTVSGGGIQVTGGDVQVATAGKGFKFSDGSVQTKAAVSGLPAVQHNATLSGDGTGGAPLSVANLGVGNAQLTDNAVTAPKIAAGQVVKSINSLEDNVTLAAGSNVTITPSGNTLTIASTVPAGSTDYIQNTTAQQASSNFNVSGNGNLGGTLTAAGAVSFAGLRTLSNATSPNVIGGFSGNVVDVGLKGATIGGGGYASNINFVSADFGTVGGGYKNTAGTGAVAGGGARNAASGGLSTVAGGSENKALNSHTTVGGGALNAASGFRATVGGGYVNQATTNESVIAGGTFNTASGARATVGGGVQNTASGAHSTVGGGSSNTASGEAASVAGGSFNKAAGSYSSAAGQRAQATHNGSFVWSDSSTVAPNFFSSTAVNQFLIKATGGVGININNPTEALHVVGSGLFTGDLTINGALKAGANRVLSVAGTNNLFVGEGAGQANTTGASNAFFGMNAGLNNNTGGFNSIFGFEAGKANLSGGGNAFFGDSAGLKNTGGGENSFYGSGAGLENLTGNQNAFFGKLAGRNTTASNNTALGFSAGKNNAGGATNTFVGNNAGLSNTSENNNTFVGASSNGAVGVSNATAVGANATVSQSNTVVLGNNADAAVTTQGKGVILRATDGANCYRVTVNNSGALSTALVTCP